MTVVAIIGSTALWLLYSWLAAAIIASYLSGRKGYGERAGLASGLLLNFIGVIVWIYESEVLANSQNPVLFFLDTSISSVWSLVADTASTSTKPSELNASNMPGYT